MISVVIPMYNRANVIARAVRSVMNQTIQDLEIVVVDDGSTDDSVKVVESINYPRLRLIKQDNGGANAARNNGIIHARGEYVAFLDSDDEFEPTMLEEQLNVFENNHDVGFLYTKLDVILPNGCHYPFSQNFGLSGNCYKEVLAQGYLAPTSVIAARKECFDIAGLFDLSLPASQDDDMCFKMAKHFKIAYIDKVLAHMYTDAGNRITNRRNPANGWWLLWNKYEDDVVQLCGHKVMALHFSQCISFFFYADMYEEARNAFRKYKSYGGKKTYLFFIYADIKRKIRSEICSFISKLKLR